MGADSPIPSPLMDAYLLIPSPSMGAYLLIPSPSMGAYLLIPSPSMVGEGKGEGEIVIFSIILLIFKINCL